VVSDGHLAMAAWHAKAYRGYVTLAYQSNRWWWTAAATRGSLLSDTTKSYWSSIYYGPGLGGCGGHDPYGPAAKDFLIAGLVNNAIERSVRSRLRTEPLPRTQLEVEATCESSFRRDFVDGYEAVQSNQTPEGVSVQFGSRTHGENSDLTSISNHFDFLLLTEIYDKSEAPKAFAVRAFKLSIWVPFVLDSRNKYALRLRDVAPAIDNVSGTVKNNTITFKLPVFAMRTGAVARGDIRVYR
jgi:hypothetical protein